MKKKYLLFILCLFAFFCINMYDVTALNRRDGATTEGSVVKYCVYRGIVHSNDSSTGGGTQNATVAVGVKVICSPTSGCVVTDYTKKSVRSGNNINVGDVSWSTTGADILHNKFPADQYYNQDNGEITCPSEVYTTDGGTFGDGFVWEKTYVNGRDMTSGLYSTLSYDSYFTGTTQQELENSVDTIAKNGQACNSTSGCYDNDERDNSLDVDAITKWATEEDGSKYGDIDPNSACYIISGDVEELIVRVFLIISVVGVVLVLVVSVVNGISAIAGNEEDSLSKFFKSLKVRIICLLILLLLPMLVSFVINVINGMGDIWGVGSDNPICNLPTSDADTTGN